jgi:hypothetical protein
VQQVPCHTTADKPTDLFQFFCYVSDLSCSKLPVGYEWAGAECVDPVLVPQQVEQVAIKATLEERHVKAVILQPSIEAAAAVAAAQ